MDNGEVGDDTRLRASLATIKRLRDGGARTVLLSHFDRPRGRRVDTMSLRPLAAELATLLGAPVQFVADCIGADTAKATESLKAGEVLLLENLRFHPGEEANDPVFAHELAKNGDLYVDDAFSAAHRAHASNEAITRLLPAFAGEALREELAALERVLGRPRRPLLGIVGGAKVSTKLDALRHLVGNLDALFVGGGMANTFLFAQGWKVGASICEEALAPAAREVMGMAAHSGCEVLLPRDVVVAERLAEHAVARVREIGSVEPEERILDAGPATVARLIGALQKAKTLVWNGPLGAFETPPFDRATGEIARQAAALAKSGKLVAVAGGGDTVAALNKAGVASDFTFISTAGGAFLEWMEGKTLPGVAALQAQSRGRKVRSG